MTLQDLRSTVLAQAPKPNAWDVVALILVISALVLIVHGGEQTTLPLSALDTAPVSLDPIHPPFYALRTTMRMLLAIVCSTIFTFVYAAIAAKSRRAEMVLIPLLDIRNLCRSSASLPSRSCSSLSCSPGKVLGAEPEDYMAEDQADEALKTIISWARYAELFADGEQSELFSLENPH